MINACQAKAIVVNSIAIAPIFLSIGCLHVEPSYSSENHHGHQDSSTLAPKRRLSPPGKHVRLTVNYFNSKIWNPGTGRYDFVRLRGLREERQSPSQISLPMAPLIEASPGTTLSLHVTNNLPSTSDCSTHPADMNVPHCFNGTNIHTHGLWVSPSGNSDNVLVDIKPGSSFDYQYDISPDHPSGTFWYHPHRHGSTALQVSSGMAGPLIIRGKRQPTKADPGDIDVLLSGIPSQKFQERILFLQQIPYACKKQGDHVSFSWQCGPGEIGFVESYDQIDPPKPREPLLYRNEDGTVNPTWSQSGRFTSVNGTVHPDISYTTVGAIERWRIIHAGNDDTVSVEFRKLREDSDVSEFLGNANAIGKQVLANCNGPVLHHFQIAVDGITKSSLAEKQESVLHPGNRTDFLVTFPESGTWCVVDNASPSGGSIQGSRSDHQLLGFVKVVNGEQNKPIVPRHFIKTELVRAAKQNINVSMQSVVIDDLNNNLALTSFVPHKSIDTTEVNSFAKPLQFQLMPKQSEAPLFMIDGHSYDPSRIDRQLKLGNVEEWELSADFVSHPFHIHVNPFQIVAIEVFYKGEWIDVSGPDAIDDFQVVNGELSRGGPIDPQYRGIKGQWMDTIFVKNIAKKPGPNSTDFSYRVKIRTRYDKYTGQFVLHCHTLDHEDQGMMQNVVIVP